MNTTSFGFRVASRAAPWGRSARGFEPENATLDEHPVDGAADHLGVAGDHPLLDVEVFAVVCLGDGGDARIAVAAASR